MVINTTQQNTRTFQQHASRKTGSTIRARMLRDVLSAKMVLGIDFSNSFQS